MGVLQATAGISGRIISNTDIAKASANLGDDIGSGLKGTGETVTKPFQKHHFLTNKSSKYTEGFEEITSKYGLDLDDAWNKELLPHQGRHPYDYHDYMYDSLQQIDEFADGNVDIFLEMFDDLKQEIIDNPDMLYKDYWR